MFTNFKIHKNYYFSEFLAYYEKLMKMSSELKKGKYSNEFSSHLNNSQNVSYPFTRKKSDKFGINFVGRHSHIKPGIELPKPGELLIGIEDLILEDSNIDRNENKFCTIHESIEEIEDEDLFNTSTSVSSEVINLTKESPIESEPLNLCAKDSENDTSDNLSMSKNKKAYDIHTPSNSNKLNTMDDSFINLTTKSKLNQDNKPYSCTVPAYQNYYISDMMIQNNNKELSCKKTAQPNETNHRMTPNDKARRNIMNENKENVIPSFQCHSVDRKYVCDKYIRTQTESNKQLNRIGDDGRLGSVNVRSNLQQEFNNNVKENHVKVENEPVAFVKPFLAPPAKTRKTSQPNDNDKFVVPRPPSGVHTKSNKSTVDLVINGKTYSVLKTLGKGGSSEVFLVSEVPNGELLAVKCVKLADVDEATKNEYLSEIRHLLRMQNSEHVIKLYDHEYVEQQKLLFVVMERGDTDLSKYLKQHRSSLLPEAITYFWAQMLFAVKSMHDNNIIHRDLKPANFLLVQGKLKLIDFGIASSIQSDQTSVLKDNRTGTFNYMSPEAFMDLGVGNQTIVKIGRKSDVWSLGCILYNFLYGKTPFQELKNPWAKFKAMSDPYHEISFPDLPGTPSMLIDSCRRCLVHDVKSRASMEELLDIRKNYLYRKY